METQRAAPFVRELPPGPDSERESSGVGDRTHREGVIHQLSGIGDTGGGEELVWDRAQSCRQESWRGEQRQNQPQNARAAPETG